MFVKTHLDGMGHRVIDLDGLVDALSEGAMRAAVAKLEPGDAETLAVLAIDAAEMLDGQDATASDLEFASLLRDIGSGLARLIKSRHRGDLRTKEAPHPPARRRPEPSQAELTARFVVEQQSQQGRGTPAEIRQWEEATQRRLDTIAAQEREAQELEIAKSRAREEAAAAAAAEEPPWRSRRRRRA